MANNTTGNPWVLDTAATISINPVPINYMEWVPGDAGDDLTITDIGGNTIWDRDALTGGNAGMEFFNPARAYKSNGFILSVIDGGTLYVYKR